MTQPSNNGTAIARVDPQLQLKAALANVRGAMSEVLPKHVTADRLIKVFLSCTARNRDLLKCTIPSLVRCIMQSAELGLELGGLLGEAYAVPFRAGNVTEAQCIIGYQGLMKLARQSGEVASIVSRVVRQGEQVEIDLANNSVKHLFSFGAEDNAPILGVYALMTLNNGERILEVMTKAQVDTIRARSKAANSGPWVTDYEPMMRKTVLRQVCKYGPKNAEKYRAMLEREEAHDREIATEEPAQFATGPKAAALIEGIAARAAAFETPDSAPEMAEAVVEAAEEPQS